MPDDGLPDLVRERALERLAALRAVGSAFWTPHPENKPQRAAFESQADELLYGGAGGGGKALALDTPLPTPDGWTTMGTVQVGDELFGDDGVPCLVVATSPVMVGRPCFRVRFSDGAEIVADIDHKWLTSSETERLRALRASAQWRDQRKRTRPSRGTGKRPDLARRNSVSACLKTPVVSASVRTTGEIAATLRTAKDAANHAVVLARPLLCAERQLVVDPYLLGCWLGDGSSYKAEITSADPEIIEAFGNVFRVRRRTDLTYGVNGGLLVALKALGVVANKHIPMVFLRASREQRVALLQGLMDTDGYCDQRGQCEFTTTRKPLARDMLDLLSSLGIKSTIREGIATLNGRHIGPKYRLKFLAPFAAFRLERKACRQKLQNHRPTVGRRYIISVDPIGSVPVRCVAVDNPSRLYLAGRQMIPTHNTDLLLGTALTRHKRSIIYRKQKVDTVGLRDRGEEILGSEAWSAQDHAFVTTDGRKCELGHATTQRDLNSQQGRARDFNGFDELAQFTLAEYLWLTAWNRTTDPQQRCRIVSASNPPLTAEGQWIIARWAPWLDKKHPHPAKDGELRWFAMIDGKDVEVLGPTPFQHTDKDGKTELIEPRSRTFIRARLDDNPYYRNSAYRSVLQALAEPIRSALLSGDFTAAMDDDPWQVIPTAWVEAAMERWTDKAPGPMSVAGVDVARGGSAQTVIAPRHGDWFAQLVALPGAQTPTGVAAAAEVIRVLRDGAVAQVDVIGVGAACLEHLEEMGVTCAAMDARAATGDRDRSGQLAFFNCRSAWWWQMREALDPERGDKIALPPDAELKADLCAPRWSPGRTGIKVEPKEDIEDRLGRSVDKGDAVVMALPQMVRPELLKGSRPQRQNDRYNPHRWRARH